MLADVYVNDVDEDRAAIGHEADDDLSNRCGIGQIDRHARTNF